MAPYCSDCYRCCCCCPKRTSHHLRDMASSDDGSDSSERRCMKSNLYRTVEDHQWPIVYSPEYNLSVLGLEKLHPFDAGKWGKVFNKLEANAMVRTDTIIIPNEATEDDLLVAHTPAYLNSLRSSSTVARITEVPPAAALPNAVLQQKFLRPMRLQTGGTVLAGKLAVTRGWAINIGGGFHHCSGGDGGGFCPYADITLCLRFLFLTNKITKAMIIDLDAHQGNGHEHDFYNDGRVYILDIYNGSIYPHDERAKRAIKRKVEIRSYMGDQEYLEKVRLHVAAALNEFKADLIVYNAGTDVLINDPLGRLSITPDGIIRRDEIVFEEAKQRSIPIVMVTSGGYQKETGIIIADSILNLWKKKLIQWPAAEEWAHSHPLPELSST
ncbi:Histone deacetylase 11 [Hypsibius exemplaris]|uniref:Histone deacetylase 11 n=1 Tax=Hypsibius exemplaris TaxID=2072580 RepID=A0A1W0WT77_HYPEX|nr:Histone deacetylase 11 [Hypsibius exemplaris]